VITDPAIAQAVGACCSNGRLGLMIL